MSRKLENLEPNKVFYYFEEVSNVPRKSGNEKELSDYMVNFANERGLKVYQDDAWNVIVWKEATAGYEDAPTVILQGHLDMVCEQNEGTGHDFSKDPIDLLIDGEWLTANGTTLGADNGIALAYILAVLDTKGLAHPALEVVFTTDEEVGLTGAQSLDKMLLKADYFINLDSEEEGEITVGCAGGLKAGFYLPIVRTTNVYDKPVVKSITIKNLKGGHSGVDIDKNRVNAATLLGRVLSHLRSEFSLRLIDINAGGTDNVIPREASAVIVMEDEQLKLFNEMFKEVVAIVKAETMTREPEMNILEKTLSYDEDKAVFSKDITDKVIFTLINVPNGIQTMSADLPGMVESSLNLGVCDVEGNDVRFMFAIRSNVRSLKYHITNQVEWFARQIDAKFIQTADYPEWPFKPESKLLEIAKTTYEKLFDKKPLVKAIHAGLEPGAFIEKLPHIEAISIGPDMEDVHSPDERLHIASAERNYRYLLEILKSIK